MQILYEGSLACKCQHALSSLALKKKPKQNTMKILQYFQQKDMFVTVTATAYNRNNLQSFS